MNKLWKIFSAAMVALVLLTVLCACGNDSGAPNTDDAQKGYVFIYNNVEIEPGKPMAGIIAGLGEPTSYYEAASCAFDGLDKMYTYGGVQISTYPVRGGDDRVLTVVLLDDSMATPEGIYVGASKAEVIAAYGEGGEDNGTSLTYKRGSTALVFLIRDGNVTSVQYRCVEQLNTK